MKDNQSVVSFRFPLDKPELLEQLTRSVSRRDWKPNSNSVLCENHFEENSRKEKKTEKEFESRTINQLYRNIKMTLNIT